MVFDQLTFKAMKKDENPLVNIYTKSDRSHPVQIVGNTSGLLTLATTLISATSVAGFDSAEVFCADGSAYAIQVSRDDSELAMSSLELPCKEQKQ